MPENWINDKKRCLEAGVPENQKFKRKQDLALEMVEHARQLNLGYKWIGCDGFYGEDPGLLRALDNLSEVFMADVHKNVSILRTPNLSFLIKSQVNVVKNLFA